MVKKCSKCGKTKDIKEFSKDRTHKDGLRCECKICESEYGFQRYHLDVEKSRELNRIRRKRNIKTSLAYDKQKYATDPIYKLIRKLRRGLNGVLKNRAKSGRYVDLLGCTGEQWMDHLATTFTEGMTRENYGGKNGWTIDHIRAYNTFNLLDEKQLKECCHYTNTQAMWRTDNCSKQDKIL
jgi:hypothetical protein